MYRIEKGNTILPKRKWHTISFCKEKGKNTIHTHLWICALCLFQYKYFLHHQSVLNMYSALLLFISIVNTFLLFFIAQLEVPEKFNNTEKTSNKSHKANSHMYTDECQGSPKHLDSVGNFCDVSLKYTASQVELRMKYSFHLLNKSYITFAHPIFLETIFEFQKNVKNPNENFPWSPFYDLHILFLCYDCIENMNKSLASEPPSIFQSTSIRTVKTIITRNHSASIAITAESPDHGSFTKPTQLSQPINISWLSNNLMVQFMILLQCSKLKGLLHSPPPPPHSHVTRYSTKHLLIHFDMRHSINERSKFVKSKANLIFELWQLIFDINPIRRSIFNHNQQ
ncbi:hypothetical protein VP01_1755g4 [Puccinia sorghi]|uniref:Uncharacterized protein n=1 Tax=Puccinia sorghi TaxID=27349 RepID=A0A0L6VFM6_9BASI|nr:hypothetical protein VP01_1755g4 [Puccinia sorghi]